MSSNNIYQPKIRSSYRKTTEQFIIDAKNIHKDKYEYHLVDYVNSKTKVRIICKTHGEFFKNPNSHLIGEGCAKCNKNLKHDSILLKNSKKFIIESNKIHNNKYDYSLVDYINARTKVNIICKEHGVFSQVPYAHSVGCGCPKCGIILASIKKTKPKEDFIKKANDVHNFKYNYDLIEYVNRNTKINIICNNHGRFNQTPHNHLWGKGCPRCANSNPISKISTTWLNSLNIESLIPEYIIPEATGIYKRKADGYDPITNIIYQFHGSYWHSDPRVHKNGIINKKFNLTYEKNHQQSLVKDFQLLCWGYNLVVMWEYDFRKSLK